MFPAEVWPAGEERREVWSDRENRGDQWEEDCCHGTASNPGFPGAYLYNAAPPVLLLLPHGYVT